MHSLLPGSGYRSTKRKVNVVVYLTAKVGPEVLPHLIHQPNLNLRVVSEYPKQEYQDLLGDSVDISSVHWIENSPQDVYRNHTELQGHKLAKWADTCVAISDAGLISLIVAGMASDIILHMFRCWDISKKIIMLPEMSMEQWKSPIWKRQLSKIQRKWEWISVLEPATWTLTSPEDLFADPFSDDQTLDLEWNWEGPAELLAALQSEAMVVLKRSRTVSTTGTTTKAARTKSALPPEIWTQVLDYLGDWELATALGVYTHTPVPYQWQKLVPTATSKTPSLEWTILTQSPSKIKEFFERQAKQQVPPKALSSVALSLILRFCLIEVLDYLSSSQKDIFWSSFPTDSLPKQASLIYNSPALLQWWKDCPAIIKKDYDTKIIDGASRAGFIDVLQWWLDSDLPMCYTDKALEGASAKGMVDVLEWWRTNHQKLIGTNRELPLKVGKSIWLAAQTGQTQSVAWWERSGIPYSHEEKVATVASQSGHVDVLDLWYSLKGSKMIFDNQVLVGPSKHGHPKVLEWWKQASQKYGLRVEYKTCDIEEAMEDAVGGGREGEAEVREWWSRNGLNLGAGTLEWMKVKTL